MKNSRVTKIARRLAVSHHGRPGLPPEGRRPRRTPAASSRRTSRAPRRRCRPASRRSRELQDMLYAQDRWAVLLIFQAMDAAGKDGAIKHVMSGVNPQGCEVYSFKQPEPGRARPRLPLAHAHARARARPHRHLQPLVLRGGARRARASGAPRSRRSCRRGCVGKEIWDDRYEDIRNFERYLARNGVAICKFFLHVSRDEQKRALPRAARSAREELEVLGERRARAAASGRTTCARTRTRSARRRTTCAPWYVVPADNKWFTRRRRRRGDHRHAGGTRPAATRR